MQAHRLTWSLRLAPSSLRRFNADPYAKAPAARWAEYRSYPRWPGWGGWLTTHAESMAAPPGRVCSSLTRCPGASQIAGMPSLFEQYSITCAPGPATTRLTSKPRYSALRLPRWSAGPRNRRTCAVCPLPEITSTQQPPGVPSGADPIASSSLPEAITHGCLTACAPPTSTRRARDCTDSVRIAYSPVQVVFQVWTSPVSDWIYHRSPVHLKR